MLGRIRHSIVRQFAEPSGPLGHVVARVLDRGNGPYVRRAVDVLDPRPGQTVADVGFGGGVGLRALLGRVGPDGTVVGVEPSRTMLQRARRRHPDDLAAERLRLLAGSLGALPLDDDSLDGAISTNTIYFVDDLDGALADLARVVRPGGRAVLGVADPDQMAVAPVVTPDVFTVRPIAQVLVALERAGFDPIERVDASRGIRRFHLLVATVA